MVLTTSFSSPLRTLEAARTEEAGPSLVGQALGSPGPSGLAARTSSGDLEQVSGAAAGLLRPGTCFESRREARWGRRGGGGAASRAAAAREGSISSAARARGGRGPSSAPPIPPRPRPGSRPRSPARAGAGPALPLAASARRPPSRPAARAPAFQLVRAVASTSWRLKVSGGRRRGGRRVNAPGAGARRRPEAAARVGQSPGGGKRAKGAQGSGPRPGWRVGGAAPWVRGTLARWLGPRGSVGLGRWPGAGSSRSGWQVLGWGRRFLLAAPSGALVRCCRPGGTAGELWTAGCTPFR